MPCVHSPFELWAVGRACILGTTAGIPTAHPLGKYDLWVGFDTTGTSGIAEPPESSRLRLACFVWLAYMPSRGLPETFESLVDIWEFHKAPPVELPAPRAVTHTIKGVKLLPAETRPELQLALD